jgi:hypothetical protein
MVDWNEWQNTLHPLFRLFTWMVSGGYSITEPLRKDALERASRLATHLDMELERTSTTETKPFLLTVRWVSFELLLRVHGASGSIPLRTLSTALVKHLFQPAFLKPAALAFPGPTVIEKLDSSQQLFQVWICLFHTLEHLAKWFHEPTGDGVVSPDTHPIWQLVRSAWESEKLSDLDASEKLWSSIFNTLRRLPILSPRYQLRSPPSFRMLGCGPPRPASYPFGNGAKRTTPISHGAGRSNGTNTSDYCSQGVSS